MSLPQRFWQCNADTPYISKGLFLIAFAYILNEKEPFAPFLYKTSIFGGFMIHKRFMRLSIALLFGLSVLISCATTDGGKAVTDTNLKAVAETYLTKTVGLTALQINALK